MKKNSDQLDNKEFEYYDDDVDSLNGYDDETGEEDETVESTESTESEEKSEEEQKKSETKSSEHDSKYFVIQKGMACCDKGAKFPNFKVVSHEKHYYNDEKGDTDYLAVTEDDLNFNPAAAPFGTCSVKNGNPCAFAPAGKWTKTYDKVKIMGKKPLTELSELMCAVGGKIKVMKHGQQTEAGKSNVANANPKEQQTYNPIMDFEEFQSEINESDQLYYE